MKRMAKRKRPRRRSLLQQLIESSSQHVLLESTRAAIEKMAEEFARDALSDPEFRAQARAEIKVEVRKLVAAMRKAYPELHGRPQR